MKAAKTLKLKQKDKKMKNTKKIAVQKIYEIQKNYEAKPFAISTIARRVYFDRAFNAFRFCGRAHDYSIAVENCL